MPIHDLGYRHWQGERSPEHQRWWVIAQTGNRLAWSQFWLRRLVLFAWVPTLVFALGFAAYEQLAKLPELLQSMQAGQSFGPQSGPPREQGEPPSFLLAMGANMIQGILRASGEALPADPDEARRYVWVRIFAIVSRFVHGIACVLIVAAVAPPLISKDVRSRAFLVYFSRPVTRGEYIAGKAATVAMFLFWATTLPALALYFLGVAIAPSLGVIVTTWDIPLRIIGSGLILIVPATAVSLCLSSVTTDSRLSSFSWLALWGFGAAAFGILWSAHRIEKAWLSPFSTFSKLQQWVFGLRDISSVTTELAIVCVASVVSIVVLFNRVSAPMRV